jgi:hypothetical protein
MNTLLYLVSLILLVAALPFPVYALYRTFQKNDFSQLFYMVAAIPFVYIGILVWFISGHALSPFLLFLVSGQSSHHLIMATTSPFTTVKKIGKIIVGIVLIVMGFLFLLKSSFSYRTKDNEFLGGLFFIVSGILILSFGLQ